MLDSTKYLAPVSRIYFLNPKLSHAAQPRIHPTLLQKLHQAN